MKSLLAALILVSACAAPDSSRQKFSSLQLEAKSLCEVMKDPSGYAGQRIVVKGIYGRQPHQRVLYDPSCGEWIVAVSHSLTAEGDAGAKRIVDRAAKKDPRGRIPVVYVGTFTMSHFLLACTERDCYNYSLEDAQLLAASPS
jgi:hypothetical protein